MIASKLERFQSGILYWSLQRMDHVPFIEKKNNKNNNKNEKIMLSFPLII